jgi:hypothetical protein
LPQAAVLLPKVPATPAVEAGVDAAVAAAVDRTGIKWRV